MIRPRFKRNERIHEIALRSHWTFSARLAVVGLVIGVLILPMLLAGKPELEALASTIRFLGWVFAAGFAAIGVFRYFVPHRDAEGVTPPKSAGDSTAGDASEGDK